MIKYIVVITLMSFLSIHANEKEDASLKISIDKICLWEDNQFSFFFKKSDKYTNQKNENYQLRRMKEYYYMIANENYEKSYDYLHADFKKRISRKKYEKVMSFHYMGKTYYIGAIDYIRPAGWGNITLDNISGKLMMFYLFRKPAEGVPVGNSNPTSDIWFNNNGEMQVVPMPFIEVEYQVKFQRIYQGNQQINISTSLTMDQEVVNELSKTPDGNKILKRNNEYEKEFIDLIMKNSK